MYAFANPNAGIVSYYNLDELAGVTANDSLGVNDGTINETTLGVAGKIGTAFTFDGADDYTTLANESNFDFLTDHDGNFTINFWQNSVTNTGYLFSKINFASDAGMWLSSQANDIIQIDLSTSAGNYERYKSTIDASTGWHMMTIINTAGIIKICTDGTCEIPADIGSGTYNGGANNSTARMGATNTGTGDWAGTLDEIGIWSVALSEIDINTLYNSGAGETYPFSVLPSITSDFNSVIDESNSNILFSDSSTDSNVTINDWAWSIDGVSKSSNQSFVFYTNANLDLNTCLLVSGLGNDGNTYSDYVCKSVGTWDTINPTIDANISFVAGFTSTFDITYNLTCFDNFSPINYKVEFFDNNGVNYEVYGSSDVNASLVSGAKDIGFAQGHFLFSCTDDYNNLAMFTSEDVFALHFRLVNEDTGETFSSGDLSNLLKAQVETIDGNFVFDFNDAASVDTDFISPSEVLIFSFTYADVAQTEVDKEFDFSLVSDSNIPICVANFQQFYEQRFVSLSSGKELSLYNTQARCYSLVGTTHYIYDTGYMLNVFTINKPYVLNTIVGGVASQLALLNGSVASEHNLDAIIFRQEDFDIQVGLDTISFSPLFNSSTNLYDLNVMQVYYKSLDGNNESVDIKIYSSNKSILYASSTIFENPDEFVFNWSWSDLNGVDDQNLFFAELTVNKLDGEVVVFGQYFNIKGDSYSINGFESIAFILAIMFILFGLTLVKAGEAFGWFGVLMCFIGLAITAFAIPVWWISLLQGTIVMIMIYLLFVSGKSKSPGVV